MLPVWTAGSALTFYLILHILDLKGGITVHMDHLQKNLGMVNVKHFRMKTYILENNESECCMLITRD